MGDYNSYFLLQLRGLIDPWEFLRFTISQDNASFFLNCCHFIEGNRHVNHSLTDEIRKDIVYYNAIMYYYDPTYGLANVFLLYELAGKFEMITILFKPEFGKQYRSPKVNNRETILFLIKKFNTNMFEGFEYSLFNKDVEILKLTYNEDNLFNYYQKHSKFGSIQFIIDNLDDQKIEKYVKTSCFIEFLEYAINTDNQDFINKFYRKNIHTFYLRLTNSNKLNLFILRNQSNYEKDIFEMCIQGIKSSDGELFREAYRSKFYYDIIKVLKTEKEFEFFLENYPGYYFLLGQCPEFIKKFRETQNSDLSNL